MLFGCDFPHTSQKHHYINGSTMYMKGTQTFHIYTREKLEPKGIYIQRGGTRKKEKHYSVNEGVLQVEEDMCEEDEGQEKAREKEEEEEEEERGGGGGEKGKRREPDGVK